MPSDYYHIQYGNLLKPCFCAVCSSCSKTETVLAKNKLAAVKILIEKGWRTTRVYGVRTDLHCAECLQKQKEQNEREWQEYQESLRMKEERRGSDVPKRRDLETI